MRFSSVLVVVVASLLFETAACAQNTRAISVGFGDRGSIQLQVPASWQDRTDRPSADVAPTIAFTPAAGAPFEVLLSPWLPAPGGQMPDDQGVRREVETASAKQSAQAVEKDIPIRKLEGPGTSGYYFSVTDRNPNPGDFKYMTQGVYAVRGVLLGFTVLTNDGQQQVVSQALEMISTANFTSSREPR